LNAPILIPRYPGDVTREWLSAVLSSGRTPVEVLEVNVVAIGTGQTGACFARVGQLCDESAWLAEDLRDQTTGPGQHRA